MGPTKFVAFCRGKDITGSTWEWFSHSVRWISNTAAGSWVQNVTFVEPHALLSFWTFCAQNRQYLAKVNFDTLFFSLTLDAVLNSHPPPRSPTFSCEETDEWKNEWMMLGKWKKLNRSMYRMTTILFQKWFFGASDWGSLLSGVPRL